MGSEEIWEKACPVPKGAAVSSSRALPYREMGRVLLDLPIFKEKPEIIFLCDISDLKTFAVFDLKIYIPICSMGQTKPVYILSFLWVWFVTSGLVPVYMLSLTYFFTPVPLLKTRAGGINTTLHILC